MGQIFNVLGDISEPATGFLDLGGVLTTSESTR